MRDGGDWVYYYAYENYTNKMLWSNDEKIICF